MPATPWKDPEEYHDIMHRVAIPFVLVAVIVNFACGGEAEGH